MTIDEFKALKQGDRISNVMTESHGTVTLVENYRGFVNVGIQWDGSDVTWHFGERHTAWMHWTLEPVAAQARWPEA